MATIGDSPVVRHAGIHEATTATPPMMAVENATDSQLTSRTSSCRTSTQTPPATAIAPSARPAPASFNPSPTTSLSRSRPTAPSAMRVPISTVRWRTA